MDDNELQAAMVLASEYLRDIPVQEPEVTGFPSSVHRVCFEYGVADNRMTAVQKMSWTYVYFANSVRVAERNNKPILTQRYERRGGGK